MLNAFALNGPLKSKRPKVCEPQAISIELEKLRALSRELRAVCFEGSVNY